MSYSYSRQITEINNSYPLKKTFKRLRSCVSLWVVGVITQNVGPCRWSCLSTIPWMTCFWWAVFDLSMCLCAIYILNLFLWNKKMKRKDLKLMKSDRTLSLISTSRTCLQHLFCAPCEQLWMLCLLRVFLYLVAVGLTTIENNTWRDASMHVVITVDVLVNTERRQTKVNSALSISWMEEPHKDVVSTGTYCSIHNKNKKKNVLYLIWLCCRLHILSYRW